MTDALRCDSPTGWTHRQHGHNHRQYETRAQEIEPRFKALSRILDPTHNIGSDKAAKISDRIDCGNAGCRRRTGHKRRRKRPETWLSAILTDAGDAHRQQAPVRSI